MSPAALSSKSYEYSPGLFVLTSTPGRRLRAMPGNRAKRTGPAMDRGLLGCSAVALGRPGIIAVTSIERVVCAGLAALLSGDQVPFGFAQDAETRALPPG
ncbi:hypothetical protein VTN96DRAFT_1317 [Rasamsonia emersonii]